jgi:hypothetical protein
MSVILKMSCVETKQNSAMGYHLNQKTSVLNGTKFNVISSYNPGATWNEEENKWIKNEITNEDEMFFASTPHGTLEFGNVGKNHFKMGQTYYVYISEEPLVPISVTKK